MGKLKYQGSKKAARVKKLAKAMRKNGVTLKSLAPVEKYTIWQKIVNHVKGLFLKIEKFNNPQ